MNSSGYRLAMTRFFATYRRLLAIAVLIAIVGWAAAAVAQTAAPAALPTAPGADRAVNGGLTQAHASLPGGPGRSPLEPYLILWLLPLSGLLTIAAGFYVDRQMLAVHRRRK